MAAQTQQLRAETEKEIRQWLEQLGEPGMSHTQWLQTRVQAPKFDKVAVRLEEMIRARRPACIVVPAWTGQLWWNTLTRHSKKRLKLGLATEVLVDVETTHSVPMEAHLITPRA